MQHLHRNFPRYLLLGFCLNLLRAPWVYAATSDSFTPAQAYALGGLGLATAGLSVYLFFVMFAPEKF